MTKETITIKTYIDKLMEETNHRLNSIENKIDAFIECADRKYASKKVENLVYGFTASLFLTLVGIIGYLLDKYTIR